MIKFLVFFIFFIIFLKILINFDNYKQNINMKKTILKSIFVILLLSIITIAFYFLFKALGINDIESLKLILNKNKAISWLIYILLFISSTVCLAFFPATSLTYITVAIILFGSLNAFILSSVSILIASIILYAFGYFGANKIIKWCIGEKSLEKSQKLLNNRSYLLLFLMYLFPLFPDDALCVVAGSIKMKFIPYLILILIGRTVGIATICFIGSGILDFNALSYIDWFVLINIILVDLIIIFTYQSKVESWIKNRFKRKKINKETIENK